MATIGQATGINDQWEVTLTVSPERVLAENVAQLMVTLAHPSFSGAIPYERFTYTFRSSDPRLQTNLSPLNGRNRIVSLPIPHMPEGSYEVSVSVMESPPAGVGPITPAFPPE